MGTRVEIQLPQRFSVLDSGGFPRCLDVRSADGYLEFELNSGDGFALSLDEYERFRATCDAVAAEAATAAAEPSRMVPRRDAAR